MLHCCDKILYRLLAFFTKFFFKISEPIIKKTSEPIITNYITNYELDKFAQYVQDRQFAMWKKLFENAIILDKRAADTIKKIEITEIRLINAKLKEVDDDEIKWHEYILAHYTDRLNKVRERQDFVRTVKPLLLYQMRKNQRDRAKCIKRNEIYPKLKPLN